MPEVAESDSALHVLTLTPFFPSVENEVNGCFVAEPIAELKRVGVQSTVIGVSPIHYPRRHASSSTPAEWVRYAQIPGNVGLSTAGKLLYARLLRRIEELHRTKPINVIHAHSALPCGHAAALLSRRLGIPFVVTVHGLDVFNTCFVGGVAAASRGKVSVDVYGAAHTVVCISGKVQAVLRTGTPAGTQSAVVYNAVDSTLFSPNRTALEKIDPEILVVGNLLLSKGQELVLRALASLTKSFPQLRCRIIGEGPKRAHYEILARELGVGPRVLFTGRQSRSAVADAMRRCSVFVLPSSNEGLGCVYLEAMSCEKPVIGCRGQGIDEVIDHAQNGWLVPVNGLEELVQGLSVLLGSPELCARMGISARQTILQRFTLSHQTQSLLGIYRQALG